MTEPLAPDWSAYPWNELRRCCFRLNEGALFNTRDTLIADLLGALGDAFPELRSCQPEVPDLLGALHDSIVKVRGAA